MPAPRSSPRGSPPDRRYGVAVTAADAPNATVPAGSAWGVGIATYDEHGTVLDTWYPSPILGATEGFLRLTEELGRSAEPGTLAIDRRTALAALRVDLDMLASRDPLRHVRRAAVATFIEDLADPPVDAHAVYPRLHLLSHRLIRPHCCNLDGIFGLLTNVVWTSGGPCA